MRPRWLLAAALLSACGQGAPPMEAHDHGEMEVVAFWTCPMHPDIRQSEPGQCPLCGMDLVAVSAEEASEGTVRVDPARRQEFGVRTAAVLRGPLVREVRAFGRVVPDETQIFDVTPRVEGWIRDLYADQTGQEVYAGQPLFALYSPALYAAQRELLAVSGRDEALVRAARERLRLWGMSEGQIAGVEAAGAPMEQVPILSPTSGRILEKRAVAGMAVGPGEALYRLAPLDPIWVEAEVYESDLPWVEVGQEVVLTSPYLPGQRWEGEVAFLQPSLDPATRTRRARIQLPNPELTLLPEMYMDAELRAELGDALLVPEEAVIYTGPRRIVFVDEGEDRLAPRVVELGRKGQGVYEVLSGLSAGEQVVVSGNFLVAAESRIRASGAWGGHEH